MAFLKLSANSVQHAWSEFCRLTWQERWLLLQAFVFLPLTAAALHLMNFQRVRLILLRFTSVPVDVCGDAALQQARTTTRLVQAAACRIPFKITCLVRSTTLWWFLRRQGIASEIRIGVNQHDKEFHAHAWVEINGIVINDKADIHQQYGAFEQIILPNGSEKV